MGKYDGMLVALFAITGLLIGFVVGAFTIALYMVYR